MGVSKEEKEEMRRWLLSKEIRFECETDHYGQTLELVLFDYKHRCTIARASYKRFELDVSKPTYEQMRSIIIRFEEEEVFPILFGDGPSESVGMRPLIRLIRED